MIRKGKTFLLVALGLLLGAPAWSDPVTLSDGFKIEAGKVGLNSESVEFRSAGGTGVATMKYAGSVNNSRTYTWPDAGADAAPVMTAGAQTVAGVKTFSSAPVFSSPPTITGGLTAANIQSGSAKRELLVAYLSPNTGAAADSTVYKYMLFPGRACTVKRINFGCLTAPTVGTDTIKVLKAASNGNTMLNAATFDANSLTAVVASPATLTATSGDLALTATQGIYCEYSAGSQTTDAVGITATIEIEPDDF